MLDLNELWQSVLRLERECNDAHRAWELKRKAYEHALRHYREEQLRLEGVRE